MKLDQFSFSYEDCTLRCECGGLLGKSFLTKEDGHSVFIVSKCTRCSSKLNAALELLESIL